MNSIEFGFVAALEREVAGVVRDWSALNVYLGHEQRKIYHTQSAALICAGTGIDRAYAATKAMIEKCSPRMVISIGFAGSCIRDLQPGSAFVPESVLDARIGKVFQCASGCGQLVTLNEVAGRVLKQDASTRLHAQAVDMEAAGVGAASVEFSREFAAIKVISDGADEDLGFLSRFVRPEGFDTLRFVAHLAFRPGLWPSVAALNRNSKLASASLQAAIEQCLGDWQGFSAKYSRPQVQV